MTTTVIGYFEKPLEAYQAVKALLDAGYKRDALSFVVSEGVVRSQPELISLSDGSAAPERKTSAGIAAGSAIGGVLGGLLGFSLMLIPGIGPVLAAGPLFGAYAGVGAGSVAGAFIGARSAWSDADEDMQAAYAEGVRRGGAVLLAQAPEAEADSVRSLMNRHGASNIKEHMTRWKAEGWVPQPAVTPAREPARDRETAQAASHETPDDATRSGTAPGVPEYMALEPVYRRFHAEHFANRPFEDYAMAYLHGFTLANDERFRNADWKSVENAIRQDWEARLPGRWHEVSQIIRFARDKALGT
jgi:hypothetical protein